MRSWLAGVAAATCVVLHGGSAFAWSFIEDAGSPGTRDAADAVLIDSVGDVVSGGWAQDPPETVLVKHSGADGSERWRFSLPGTASTMHLFEDAQGNILAAIHSYDSPVYDVRYTPGNSVVVKLSASGAELWRVDLPGVWLHAADLNEAGELVVGGRTPPTTSSPDWDLFVAVFDSSGTELWRRAINSGLSTASEQQMVRAVRFDQAGDVVVGGGLLLNAALGLPDFIVLKLARTDGSEIWRDVVPSTDPHGGAAWALAIDSNGDVLAAGQAVLIDWCDAVVVKLNGTNGAEAWRTVIDEPGIGSCDYMSAVAVNDEGEVFATGAPGTGLYSVFRLSGDTGAQVWRHDLPNLSEPTGGGCCGGKEIGIRADGSVVSMGIRLGPTQTSQIAVTRLDPADGHELFLHIIDTDGCGDSYPAMALGPEGDIAVAASVFRRIGGECLWPQGYDYGVFKFTGLAGLDFWGGCQDERDNDGDGLVDFSLDPGCASPTASTESPACNNGIDDDNDGRIDTADPGCTGPAGDSEFTAPPGWGCGLGPELTALVALLYGGRRARRWLHGVDGA